MKRIAAAELYDALEKEFRPWECTEVFPKIGIQEHNTDWISRVYTATFVSEEVIRKLEMLGAREAMLFTHHPAPQRISPSHAPASVPQEHLDFLRERKISLFSYHIPLDRNGPYSPGNTLASAMGADVVDEFYQQDGVYMGVICRYSSHQLEDLRAALEETLHNPVSCYPYGGPVLEDGKFAIMAGGAKNHAIYKELKEVGVTAFITGVTNPEFDWVAENHARAKEFGVSILGGTHCATEKFAPMAMTTFFRRFGIGATFLSEEPHLNEL